MTPDKPIHCMVCRRNVPKKKLTAEAIKKGFGLCSTKCSKLLVERLGVLIPNRMGKKQFKANDHYNPKLAPWNRK